MEENVKKNNIFLCVCACALRRSVLSDSPATPWTEACQAPLPMGIFQARILEWVAMPASMDFSTQGSNPGLPHCRWILYCLRHQGSPRILEWVAYPFSSRSSWPRDQTHVSCIAGAFFTAEPPGKSKGPNVEVKVTQSYPTLCDPMDCTEFSRPEYRSGEPFPSPGDLPNPGIEPRSSTLQVDSLLSETSGKPKKTAVGSLSLPQLINLPNPGLDQGLLRCRRIPYQLSYQRSPKGLNSTILLIVSTNYRHNLSR